MNHWVLRAVIWVLSFVPVAFFTALVSYRLSDTLPIGSATRDFFLFGLLVVTLLAAATVKRALVGMLHRWQAPDASGP